ncbi:DUF1652 domain-containing protein [Pseudomonas fluorescens]|uniref:DUF1652 domain-containing protein n=1 Tax=Pseudomonas TaxID=286 RepID=UPI003D07B6B9
MISIVEICHLIEKSFLPNKCECVVAHDLTLTVRIFHPGSEREMFVVTGISVMKFQNGHDVAGLIKELRDDVQCIRPTLLLSPNK